MNIIRKRRKELGYSQMDMERSLNIRREKIGKLERGDVSMNLRDLKKICEFLKIDWELYYQDNGVKVTEKI